LVEASVGGIQAGVEVIPIPSVASTPGYPEDGGLMVQVSIPQDWEPVTCRVITRQQHLPTTHPIPLTNIDSH